MFINLLPLLLNYRATSFLKAKKTTYFFLPIFFMVFLPGFMVYGQNLLHFDSLLKANDAYKKEDTKKLKLLTDISRSYSHINPFKGKESSEASINLARKLNDENYLTEAYLNKGLNHMAMADYKTANECFEKAFSISDSIRNTRNRAWSLYYLGEVHRFKGESARAIEKYEQVLPIFNSLGHETGVARVYKSMSSAIKNSDAAKALEYNNKSFDINRRAGNQQEIAANHINYGNLFFNQSNFSKALESYQKALEIAERFEDKLILAQVLGNIGLVYFNLSNYLKTIEHYQRALTIDESLGNKGGVARHLGNIATVYGILSDYPKSLEYFNRVYSMFEEMGNKGGMSTCLGNMGNVYKFLGNQSKSLESYEKALKIDELLDNKEGIARHYTSIGSLYIEMSDFNQALKYYQNALGIAEKINRRNLIASLYNNIASAYLGKKEYTEALDFSLKARELSHSLKTLETEKNAVKNLSECYEKMGRYDSAYAKFKEYSELRDSILNDQKKKELTRREMQFEFDKKATEFRYQQQLTEEKLARSNQELNLKEQRLIIINKEQDLQKLAYLKKQAELQSERLLRNEKEKEFAMTEKIKQNEIGRLKAQNEIERLTASKRLGQLMGLLGVLLGLLFVAVAFYYQNKKKQRLNEQLIHVNNELTQVNVDLSIEKKKSDDLLLNILPEQVAQELKEHGQSKARNFGNVSVLFTDFVNFTGISERLSPEELVHEIDQYFKAFDRIVDTYGLEKIKTIGDAYMAVCGLPHENQQHARNVVNAALAIREYVNEYKASRVKNNEPFFDIRIGVNSGAVVAGIVGLKKFAFDIWGDTVNIASRIESSGEPGKVNISGSTYELIKDEFDCSYRGKIPIKNRGEIDMYFVIKSKA